MMKDDFDAARERKTPLVKGHEIMGDELEYQVRFNLTAEFTELARNHPASERFAPLYAVLKKHNATMKNQYDAFADFCKLAEKNGDTDTVLYRWTKATIEKPEKKEQYAPRYTVYADGGKETYSKEVADAVEADLKPLIGLGIITKVDKFDTDPANNPQAPARFHV